LVQVLNGRQRPTSDCKCTWTTRSVAFNPNLALAFAGERVDTYAKESVARDPSLSHLIIPRRGQPGPDFSDPANNTWYDITTARDWPSHVQRYTPTFGQGFPLFYRMEDRK